MRQRVGLGEGVIQLTQGLAAIGRAQQQAIGLEHPAEAGQGVCQVIDERQAQVGDQQVHAGIGQWQLRRIAGHALERLPPAGLGLGLAQHRQGAVERDHPRPGPALFQQCGVVSGAAAYFQDDLRLAVIQVVQ